MVASVLVGVDDSEGAKVALRWAEDLVSRERQKGHHPTAAMLTTWSRPAVDTKGIFDDAVFRAAATDLLDRLAAGLADRDRFEPVIRQGHPAQALLDEAIARDVDLIVVGTRGRGALAQVILGSVSRSVAARADRPVAVIPVTTQFGEGPTVVAYDGSDGAKAALRWAIDNVEGEIKVVSAWTLPSTPVYDPTDVDVLAFEEHVARELDRGLEEICGGTPDPRLTPLVQHTDARLAILDDSLKPARIVMGARAAHGLKGLMLGSTVNYVATHSPTAVIIVPPPSEGA